MLTRQGWTRTAPGVFSRGDMTLKVEVVDEDGKGQNITLRFPA
jgi:hypothetical protein